MYKSNFIYFVLLPWYLLPSWIFKNIVTCMLLKEDKKIWLLVKSMIIKKITWGIDGNFLKKGSIKIKENFSLSAGLNLKRDLLNSFNSIKFEKLLAEKFNRYSFTNIFYISLLPKQLLYWLIISSLLRSKGFLFSNSWKQIIPKFQELVSSIVF